MAVNTRWGFQRLEYASAMLKAVREQAAGCALHATARLTNKQTDDDGRAFATEAATIQTPNWLKTEEIPM
jgi:hypothetical protein